MQCYIGLMSGTSTDGVDGVLIDFSGSQPTLLAFASAGFDPTLREQLLALNTPGPNELHRAALAANALVRVYAAVVTQLLQQSGLHAGNVVAIGAHGQTVRHQPGQFDTTGYTWQINQPALLAELTRIRVIADFRSRDVAAGGQGAPLVPAFHDTWFAQPEQAIALLNLGGIANISVLPARNADAGVPRPILGFDCGPGNVLLDAWCQLHQGLPFDAQGQWAAMGHVCAPLLERLLDVPYFLQAPPKSTGRDLFNWAWLQDKCKGFESLAPVDVQATLVALTVESVRLALQHTQQRLTQLLVCGGGAFNTTVMGQLAKALPSLVVTSTSAHGLAPLQVEAAAFAWLAKQHCHALAGNLPEATGAQGPRVLGACYPV